MGNKRAKQNTNSETRFVMVDQNMGKKEQKIAFKFIELKNWVGIGIGLRNTLKNAKYHFNCNFKSIKIIIQNMEVI